MTMRLRQLQSKDCLGMLEWMHDPEQVKYFRVDMSAKREKDVVEFIKQADTIPQHGKSIHYAIVDEADEYLGTISLKAINLQDRNAEYAISLRRTAQGRNVAYDATKELLDIAFSKLNLERVYLNVLSENERAIRLYEKCGFILEGEFRNHLCLRGQYQNLMWYAMLKTEYQKNSIYRGEGYKPPLILYTVFLKCVERRLAA